jgi:hypothetical protein
MLDALVNLLVGLMQGGLTALKAPERGPAFVARASLFLFALIVLFLAFGLYINLSGR